MRPREGAAGKASPVEASGPGARQLVSDFKRGRIKPDAAFEAALTKLHRASYPVARKYRDARLVDADVRALTVLAGQASKRLTAKQTKSYGEALRPKRASSQSRLAATSSPSCEPDQGQTRCTWETDHFVFSWPTTGPTGLTPARVNDTQPQNGIPDVVDETRATMDLARDFYTSIGFGDGETWGQGFTDTAPPDGLYVQIYWAPLEPGVSLPDIGPTQRTIGLPVDYNAEYLPAHELFHQFQYQYADGLDIIENANWFQEASAEWATEQFMIDRAGQIPSATPWGEDIPAFLGTPNKRLNHWDGFAGDRQYGAVPFVDYMAFLYGDYVQNVLKQFRHPPMIVLDESEAMEETLEGYDSTMSAVMSSYWWTMYVMCGDPGQPQSLVASEVGVPWELRDKFAAYCANNMGSLPTPAVATLTKRPTHADATATGSGTWQPEIGARGAAFLDLTPPAGADQGLRASMTLNVPSGSSWELWLIPWGDNPAYGPNNYACDSTVMSQITDGPTSLTTKMTKACSHLTAMIVNTDATSGEEEFSVSAAWEARSADLAIQSSSVALAVDEYGSNRTSKSGAGLLNAYTNAINFRHLSTNAELGVFGSAGQWSLGLRPLAGPDVVIEDFYKWYDEDNASRVTSFTYDTAEATSVVEEAGFRVTHHYYFTPNPNIVRCDVTIEAPPGGGMPTSFTYRRGISPNPDSANMNGAYSTTADWDTSDSSIAAANSDGAGGLGNPNDPPSPWSQSAPFTDKAGASPSFDIGSTVGGLTSSGDAHFSLLFAANPSGAEQAASTLQALGSTLTFAVTTGESYSYDPATEETTVVNPASLGWAFGYVS